MALEVCYSQAQVEHYASWKTTSYKIQQETFIDSYTTGHLLVTHYS